ncbi:MAG: DUF1294 domain-containing protein [Clostridia bacterium]|nr:DUF1294 domain-containing protein [Clostridia bacterium]
MTEVILIYLCLINLVAVIVTVADKNKAKKGRWRVKECTLFAVALLGGAALMYITMLTIRHKTLHLRFMLLLPVIAVVEAVALCYLLNIIQGGV